MATPRSVKKQADEAKRLQEDLNRSPEDPGPAKDPKLEQAPKATAEPETSEPQPAEKRALEGGDDNPGDSPAVGEEPPADQNVDWEKRYKGMKQLYDREVPKLRAALDAAEQRNADLQQQIADLRQEVQSAMQQPTQTSAQPQELEISEEEREQYGEAQIELMARIARQTNSDLAKQVVDLQNQLAAVKQDQDSVKKTVEITTENEFFSELGRLVKEQTGQNWKDINKDSGFHAYLAEVNPETGYERQAHLSDAHKALDPERAARFFVNYAGKKPAQPSSAEQDVSSQPSTPAPVPEEIVQPTSQPGDVPHIDEPTMYTTADINKFYRDKTDGKYKGKEDEARKIEEDILAAGREGRILDGTRGHAYA